MIRVLGDADVNEFRRVRLEALESEPRAYGDSTVEFAALPKERVLAFLRAGNTLGGFDGDRLVAIGGLYQQGHLKARHKATIWGVWVAPEARGRGLARGLMEALIAHARGLDGVEQVDLAVAETQPAARRLYQRLGFQFWGKDPRAMKVDGVYVAEELGSLVL